MLIWQSGFLALILPLFAHFFHGIRLQSSAQVCSSDVLQQFWFCLPFFEQIFTVLWRRLPLVLSWNHPISLHYFEFSSTLSNLGLQPQLSFSKQYCCLVMEHVAWPCYLLVYASLQILCMFLCSFRFHLSCSHPLLDSETFQIYCWLPLYKVLWFCYK